MQLMLLVTQTHNTAMRFGDNQAIRLLAQAGYDAIDLTMFADYNARYLFSDGYKDYAEGLLKTARECGVCFKQAHAPFPSYRADDEPYSSDVYSKIIRCIEIAGMLGIENLVVHPFTSNGDKKADNMKFYRSLAPYAVKSGVKIALENMWKWDSRRGCAVANVCSVPDEFCEFADELGSENFSVCLDIGHCGLVGEDEVNFIRKLGSRLSCLHVHDTDYRSDLHTLPFMGKIDYEAVCAALKEIRYGGNLTFEADNFLLNVPDELVPAALKYMAETGRYLISRCK